jgi:hypothetical protein
MTSQTPGRKRPWYARPPRFLNQATSVKGYATADNEDGFTREVELHLTMDEPGKGGTTPPQREVIVRYTPADAVRAATQMIVRAHDALAKNRQHNDGGGYTHHWNDEPTTPRLEPGPGNNRMAADYAASTEALVLAALDRVAAWQDGNPHIADYRVTEAHQALVRAGRLLSYLKDGTDPEGDAARVQLKASGFFGPDAPQHEVGATYSYRYYGTEADRMPVTVQEVHDGHLVAALVGTRATIRIPADRYDRLDPAAPGAPANTEPKAIFCTNRWPKVGAHGQYYGTSDAPSRVEVTVWDVYDDEVILRVRGTDQSITVPRTDDDLRTLALGVDDWEVR